MDKLDKLVWWILCKMGHPLGKYYLLLYSSERFFCLTSSTLCFCLGYTNAWKLTWESGTSQLFCISRLLWFWQSSHYSSWPRPSLQPFWRCWSCAFATISFLTSHPTKTLTASFLTNESFPQKTKLFPSLWRVEECIADKITLFNNIILYHNGCFKIVLSRK